MTHATTKAERIDAIMRRWALVAILCGIGYLLLGFVVLSRSRTEWRGSAGFWTVGTPGTDSFVFIPSMPLEPVRLQTTGYLDISGSGTHPYLVHGWLGLMHPGIPLKRTQISVAYSGDDGVRTPITTRQLWDRYVPLTTLAATARDPIHGNDEDDVILDMLRNRQTTKWSIAWSDVASLLAQAVCGVVCIIACVRWYRLLKVLSHVEAGGCLACGYDRAGLKEDAACPECGAGA